MKLSIITVNLNNAEGLRKTLDSVFIQTFRDYEHIIIDGASTDGSIEIIKQYAEKAQSSELRVQSSEFIAHSSVYWLSEPDKGVYNATNKGILRAKGEYCLFLNSGDYFVNGNVLDKVFAIPFTEDVVYGFLGGAKNGEIEMMTSPKEVTLRTFVEGTIHHTGNAFIRRDAFDRWGLYDENLKIASDRKWFLKAIGLDVATTRYIDVMTSVFDCNGISSTQKTLNDLEKKQMFEELIPRRILADYLQFNAFDEQLLEKEKELRRTLAYRLGYAILFPIKKIRQIICKR